MKNIAKFVTLLVVTIIISLPALAKYEVVESNSNGFTVVYTPELKSINTKIIQGNEYAELVFDDAGNLLNELGYPQILGAQKTFAIPSPTDYEIANVEVGPLKEYNSKIAPVYVLGEENYVDIDDRAYKNRPLEDWANVEYMGIGRDLHLAKLNLIAAKYNPAKNAIEVPEYIKITVKFDSKNNTNNVVVKSDLRANLINSNVANNWKISDNELFNQIGVEKNYKLNTIQGTEELSSGDWFKITIKDNGVYELTSEYLKNNGINIPTDKLNTIKIIGNGGRELPENPELGLLNDMNQQPIRVNTNSDGSLKSIVFFGAAPNGFEYVNKQNLFDYNTKKIIHYINHFSNENHYLLTWGGDARESFEQIDIESSAADEVFDTFTRRVYFEEDLVSAFHGGAGKQFFGRTYFSESFEHDLVHLADEGNILYRLVLGHKGTAKSDGKFSAMDHEKLLSENLQLKYTEDELRRKVFDLSFPINEIPNKNKVNLKFEYTNAGYPGAKGVFDFYELHYTSYTKPDKNGELFVVTDPSLDGVKQYDFTGFSGDVYAYDITDIANPIEYKSTEKGNFTLRDKFIENEPKSYFVSSNLKEPINIQSTQIADLRKTKFNSDVIVITHKKLMESAKKFKEYRESNSDFKIDIFYVDEIYNEYNAGTMDISAIRDFVAQSMANWDNKPKYMVLWGDGHYDYRGLTTNKENLVPPYENKDDNQNMKFVQSYFSDDYYARVVGNDRLIDLAHGRLTINDEQEGEIILNKLKHYENNSEISNWRTKVSLVADDGFGGETVNGDGSRFVNDSEELALTRVPNFMEQNKIYSVEYQTQYTAAGERKPGANAAILNTVNEEGVLMLNWYGHGNPQVWSHEAILDRDVNVRQMVNYDRLFFLTAATCDFAKFDNVDIKSGAESMMLNEFGGAIGVFAAARVVYASQNHDINRAFYDIMFTRDSTTGKYPTLGEVIFNLKQTFNASNDEKYFLLGDPTATLLIPELDVVIDNINGLQITDTTEITVKGLQTVSVSGYIADPQTNEIDSEFNGKVKLKIFDGEVEFEVKDAINRLYRFTKDGGTLANANYEVVNGRFEAEFILPKDISFSENYGKILAYAFTDDHKNAKGNFDNLKVDGLATTSVTDNQGPEINIYLDSRSFNAGDIVRNEPLLIVDLEDESGINSTGVGVGHKIEAWIDDNSQSIDLTSDYESSFVDYRKGTSSKLLLDLEPGAHVVKVRAWDIFNNYSTDETYFNIDSDGNIVLDNVLAAPTPFNDETTITFNHNMEPPLDAQMDIFDASGKKIKSVFSTLLNPFEGEFKWDGTDSGGSKVSIGTYYFRIKLDNLTENNTFLKGRTVKIK